MSQQAGRKPRTPVDRTVVQLDTGQTLRRGRTWPSIGAYAVDVIVGAVLWGLFAVLLLFILVLLPTSETLDNATGFILIIGSFFTAVAFYGLFYGLRRTLGQTIFGLRTVRTSDGGRVGAWRGMARMLGGALLVPGIPIIIVGMVTSGSSFTRVSPPRFVLVATR